MTKVLGCQVTPRHTTPSRGRRAASVPSHLKRRGGKETNSHSCRRGTSVISGEGLSAGSPGGTAHRRTTAAAFLRNPLRKVKTRTRQPREEQTGRQQYRVRDGTPDNGQASTWQRCLKRGHPLANGHGGHPAHLLFCFPETPRFCKPYISHCYSDPPHQTHGWQLLTNCHQPPAAQPLLSASRKGGLEEWVFKTPSFSTMACIHTRLHQHCPLCLRTRHRQHRNVPPHKSQNGRYIRRLTCAGCRDLPALHRELPHSSRGLMIPGLSLQAGRGSPRQSSRVSLIPDQISTLLCSTPTWFTPYSQVFWFRVKGIGIN